MVSRRNFVTITLIMLVLFFLYQFSGAAKEVLNEYGQNPYAQNETELTSDSMSQGMNDETVLFVGSTQSELYSTVSQWCIYTKRGLQAVDSASSYEMNINESPEVVIIDSTSTDLMAESPVLEDWVSQGVNIIFGNLPDAQVISESESLKKMLGVRYVNTDSIDITGVHLFAGFLLGGEEYYEATNEKEEEMQDLSLNIPWYVLSTGTKTYMLGMLDEDKYGEVKNEYLPAIIWRNSEENTRIFAVNGDYMNGTTGIGILDAMMSEMNSYEIYPVVNSQNLVVLNYPMFAQENEEMMQETYSRNTTSVLRDIVWPGIVAVAEKSNAKVTCMFTSQLNYSDDTHPDGDTLNYFMRLVNEVEGEAGISLSQESNISLENKLEEDKQFLETNLPDYTVQMAYIDGVQAKEAVSALEQFNDSSIKTIYTNYEDSAMPVSYYDSETVSLSTTNDGFSHTYSQDLRLKSIETALAYSSISADFAEVIYPENDDETWEKLYDQFSSYTLTFWKAFDMFTQTTLSEADTRVRQFLASDYSDRRDGEVITLNVANVSDNSWYILRIHQQDIKEISGGSYTQIEEGAYLIQANSSKVVISLKGTDDLYYYNK